MTGRRAVSWLLAASLAAACTARPGEVPLILPQGSLARLEVKVDGRRYGFGPFVGYYFRPADGTSLDRLEFWCFNERGFYASDAPHNALLFTGEAVLARLPSVAGAVPAGPERIRPVFFPDAPPAWLATRPPPEDEFVHFHSAYDAMGPALLGYWLRHEGRGTFTYDMGGRVGDGSPLYHAVAPGPDRAFAAIVEFDAGPRRW